MITYCQLDTQEKYCDISTTIQIFSIQNIELNGTHIVQVWSGLTINIGKNNWLEQILQVASSTPTWFP